jgi:hypothetical protein
MRSDPPAQDQARSALRILIEEDSFRERRRAIRHHRHLIRFSVLALNAAWAVGMLSLGLVVVAILVGLLRGQ